MHITCVVKGLATGVEGTNTIETNVGACAFVSTRATVVVVGLVVDTYVATEVQTRVTGAGSGLACRVCWAFFATSATVA